MEDGDRGLNDYWRDDCFDTVKLVNGQWSMVNDEWVISHWWGGEMTNSLLIIKTTYSALPGKNSLLQNGHR